MADDSFIDQPVRLPTRRNNDLPLSKSVRMLHASQSPQKIPRVVSKTWWDRMKRRIGYILGVLKTQ